MPSHVAACKAAGILPNSRSLPAHRPAPTPTAAHSPQTGKLRGASLGPTLAHLYASEGLPGLFRGNGASVLRIVPYAASHFYAYEHYRRLLVDLRVLGVQVRVPVHLSGGERL